MGSIAIKVIKEEDPEAIVTRYTVPGIKDIPIAAKKLLEEGCDGVITLGWVGKSLLDKFSYLAASIGIITAQLLTSKHIIDVTVHEDEAESEDKLKEIAVDRTKKHAKNLVLLVRDGRNALTPFAGKGLRQGYRDAGPID
jgi:riboflavin synthase